MNSGSLLAEEHYILCCGGSVLYNMLPDVAFLELMPNLRLTKSYGIIVCQVIHLKS